MSGSARRCVIAALAALFGATPVLGVGHHATSDPAVSSDRDAPRPEPAEVIAPDHADCPACECAARWQAAIEPARRSPEVVVAATSSNGPAVRRPVPARAPKVPRGPPTSG